MTSLMYITSKQSLYHSAHLKPQSDRSFQESMGLGGWGAVWDIGHHYSSVNYELENRGHICKEKQIYFVREKCFYYPYWLSKLNRLTK